MQINDVVNQYYNNLSAGSRVEPGVEGIRQVSSTLQNLQQGQVFEASVLKQDGDQILLSLLNGQNISARLGGDVSLLQGESIFFEVKTNSGNTIELSPLSLQQMNEPVLLQALDQANLPSTERNLMMVDLMMKNELPVDSNSLQQMVKQLSSNPETPVSTIVTMNRLELPTSPEMVAQFENYMADKNEILQGFSEVSSSISEAIAQGSIEPKDAIELELQIYEILTEEDISLENVNQDSNAPVDQAKEPPSMSSEGILQNPSPEIQQNELSEKISTQENISTSSGIDFEEQVQLKPEESVLNKTEHTLQETTVNTVSYSLKGEVLQEFQRELQNLGDFKEQFPEHFKEDGSLKGDIKTADLLRDILQYVKENPEILKEHPILEKEGFSSLRQNLLEQSFTISPEKLTEKEQPLKELYKNLVSKMTELDASVQKLLGQENPASKAIHNVEDNVKFMDQVNQNLAYVQIPLQLAGQNATGELYIYKNSHRKVGNEDGSFTAFLHFDLQHLGSTDVSVKMKDKKVETKFYFDDDTSYEIVEQYLPELDEKLRAKGFDCTLVLSKDEEPANFITSMIEKDAPVGGDLKRYSFDRKA